MSKDTKITVDIPILGGRDIFLWVFVAVIVFAIFAALSN